MNATATRLWRASVTKEENGDGVEKADNEGGQVTKSMVRRSKCETLVVRQSIQIDTGNANDWRKKRTKQAVIKGESPFKLRDVNPSNLRLWPQNNHGTENWTKKRQSFITQDNSTDRYETTMSNLHVDERNTNEPWTTVMSNQSPTHLLYSKTS